MNKNYIKYKNIIYKYNPIDKYWLQMTKVKHQKDRRTYFDFDVSKYIYNAEKARSEINEYWDNYTDIWTYNGKEYDNLRTIHFAEKQTFDLNTDITYTYWGIKKDFLAKSKFIIYGLHNIVWYQGKLYWMLISHYLPQCQLFEFIDENKVGNFIKWTHVKHVRGVWCRTTNNFI